MDLGANLDDGANSYVASSTICSSPNPVAALTGPTSSAVAAALTFAGDMGRQAEPDCRALYLQRGRQRPPHGVLERDAHGAGVEHDQARSQRPVATQRQRLDPCQSCH